MDVVSKFKISNDILDNYIHIHDIIFKLNNMVKRKKTFEQVGMLKRSIKNIYKKYKIYDAMIELIKNTKELLILNGIEKFSDSEYYLEFQRGNILESDSRNKTCKFPLHLDDYGTYPNKQWTIVYYIRKDRGIKGGNFRYKIHDKLEKTEIEEGDVLIFPGNIKHGPEPMWGFGCRDIIVLQFIRK